MTQLRVLLAAWLMDRLVAWKLSLNIRNWPGPWHEWKLSYANRQYVIDYLLVLLIGHTQHPMTYIKNCALCY